MVFMTGFGLVFAFMVATSEGIALSKITLGSVLETEQYPNSLSHAASLALSGGRLTSASQRVIYYSTPYNLDFYAAKAYCESRGTYIATLEELEIAYPNGFEGNGCGWAANGIPYHVMQDTSYGYHTSVGIRQCSFGSSHGVFCKRPITVFMSKDHRGDYSMTLAEARQHCHMKGTRLATYEDLLQAYSLGYEDNNCGWADNGLTYVLVQNPSLGPMTNAGVIKCNGPTTLNAFCKGSEWETEQNPISFPVGTSLPISGRRFAAASQRVIYYSSPYNIDFYAAKTYCESRGTFIATLEDLKVAYQNGYQGYSCGWTANGISYRVTQDSGHGYYSSTGVSQCLLGSTHGVFCRRPITDDVMIDMPERA